MRTIIIGDGLTRRYLSPELPFRDSKSNVGRSESERLLGKGKLFGKGPLPTFLRRSLEARSAGADFEVVLLEASDENPDAFIDALEDVARQAVVIA